MTRTPSAGSISCLATGADAHALTFHSSPALAPHPCHPPRIDPRGQREPPRKAAPLASALPASPRLAFHLAASSSPVRHLSGGAQWERCVFPASATDNTTRALHGSRESRHKRSRAAPGRAPLDGGPPASVRMGTWLPVSRRPSRARSSRPVKPVIAGSAERCSLFYDPRRVRPGWGCHPASDARCRDPHEEDRQARLGRRLVKGDRCTGPERLPSAAWPSFPLAFTRSACARPAPARLPESCPPTSAIECDPRARPRTHQTPV